MVKVITTTGEVLIGVDWVIPALFRIPYRNVWETKSAITSKRNRISTIPQFKILV